MDVIIGVGSDATEISWRKFEIFVYFTSDNHSAPHVKHCVRANVGVIGRQSKIAIAPCLEHLIDQEIMRIGDRG